MPRKDQTEFDAHEEDHANRALSLFRLWAWRASRRRSAQDIYSLGIVLFQLVVEDFSQPVTMDWWKQVADPLIREDLEHCFLSKVAPVLPHLEWLDYAEFSSDGRRVVTACGTGTRRAGAAGMAMVWDAASGEPITAPMEHSNRPVQVSFSPDGRRIVTASFDRTVRVWDAETGQPITPPLGHSNFV